MGRSISSGEPPSLTGFPIHRHPAKLARILLWENSSFNQHKSELRMPSSLPSLTHASAPPPTCRIHLELIDPNPYQPCSEMNEATLEELIASIRDHGLLQPITVQRVARRYQLIAGHRRLAAFKRLLRRGLGWHCRSGRVLPHHPSLETIFENRGVSIAVSVIARGSQRGLGHQAHANSRAVA